MQNKIIQFLKTADGYISGEAISRHLRISRAGIWKYMQELRRQGYVIEAVPHLGYRLASSPDKLLPAEVQARLSTGIIGKKIIYEDSVPSTMDVAFRLGVEGEPEGTVICAETQTKGKGRLGRIWHSPKGKGIYASVILRPQCPPAEATRLTLLAAVAVCEAIREAAGLKARIKWPNDILVDGKKAAGILTEMSADMDRVRFVVVGIGVNVNTPLTALPETAVSLKHAAGKKVSRVEVFQALLTLMERWYLRFRQEGFAPVTARWKELSSTLGKKVRWADLAGQIEGEAVDLDADGGLVIRGQDGSVVKKMSGDILQVG